MGMDSRRLSERTRQPGHDRSFRTSEDNFVEAARRCLDPNRYEVEAKPSDLRDCFPADEGRHLGLQPEASITSKATGRKFFIEVKTQGPRGNAEERACKHHTVHFYNLMRGIYPDYGYHPYVTIFCEHLAVQRRYTVKAQYLFEPDQYFEWVDYDLEPLCAYLRERCSEWLDA